MADEWRETRLGELVQLQRVLINPADLPTELFEYYAGLIIRHPEMENPTIVALTNRNDLDDQLFGVFSRCRDLLG